jgi:PTH1 family peptidyl-tRNA hydrolase
MKLIVGLGNPGKEFYGSRHNLGFEVVSSLAKKFNLRFKSDSYSRSEIAKCRDFVLVKPQTFMNLSGFAVRSLIKRLDLDPKDLLVVFDDITLDFGRIKIAASGSSGGHNGMNSIIESLSSKDFPRLRIGIDSPKRKSYLTDFVLDRFTKEEAMDIAAIIGLAVDCCCDFVDFRIDYVMNKYNKRK